MHLLLMIPSSLLLALLFIHSWRYRGKKTTLAFFGGCFIFGLIRGNVIYDIITGFLKGETLPYRFLRPVVSLGHASLQECIGWIFALYLCWSTVEWVLSRQGNSKIGLFRLIGLSGFLMGGVSYAVEAASAAVKWWVWVFPIRNPFYAEVPFVGIVEWISVIFDFLLPFLLIRHKVVRGKWIAPVLLPFPLHMLAHFKVTDISPLLPLTPNELWHWLMLCLLFWGIAVGGPEITPWTAEVEKEPRGKSWRRFAVLIAVAGFILTLALVHFVIIHEPEVGVSLVPFITGVLFFNPLYAAIFLVVSCTILGLFSGAWSYMLVPLLLYAVFAFGSRWSVAYLNLSRRKLIGAAVLVLSTVSVIWYYHERQVRYKSLQEAGREIVKIETVADLDRLLDQLPAPEDPADAFHYNRLGIELNKRRNYTAGRRILEKALSCDSTYAYAWFNLGWSLRNLGKYGLAIRAYEKGLEFNPIDFGSYLLLGEIYVGLDSLKQAEGLYRRALSYDKKNAEILLALESVLYSGNRLDEAIALLKAGLPDAGDRQKLASRLAADLFKAGKPDQAIAYYAEVIREDAEHLSAAALSLALIYWNERKEPQKALEYAELATRVKPTADSYMLKGAICEELGLKDQARESYRVAESLKQ